jgi:hypothetical protein
LAVSHSEKQLGFVAMLASRHDANGVDTMLRKPFAQPSERVASHSKKNARFFVVLMRRRGTARATSLDQ